ncbi:MAG: uracil phosphoribosyltransferase [Ignavibacteriales bacterium]|nr:uracil phosphoribosyltransferase [Ignavibacteriales bacterium]
MKNFKLIDHPIIKRDLTILRDKKTPSSQFRPTLRRISIMLAFEAARDLKLKEFTVQTPLEKTKGYDLKDNVVLVPVLRAGLGIIGGFLDVFSNARVGHIGLARNEQTLEPVDYYFKIPQRIKRSVVFLLDPMLATGGSGSAAIKFLRQRGAETVRYVCLVAAPEGVKRISKDHPDVIIYSAALDRELNNKGYILPGLGDAGDRVFGTNE